MKTVIVAMLFAAATLGATAPAASAQPWGWRHHWHHHYWRRGWGGGPYWHHHWRHWHRGW